MSSLDVLSPPKPKILDFDIENRPLTYLGKDFTTAEITAIAASWHSQGWIWSGILGEDEPEYMLTEFATLYDEADIVTGHYIRKHDLPTINGAMLEYGMPPLGPKLTSDTYMDLKDIKGISKSQENLAAMLGIVAPKMGMSQIMWRQANRLTPEGIELTRQRVIADVRQHQELREQLLRLGMLGPPRMWRGEK